MKTDVIIQNDVIEHLRWDPILRTAKIGVSVHQGVVTLSGQVEKYAMKTAAEQAAKQVQGVRAVAQEMEVGLIIGETPDEDIARTVLNAFHWNTEVPEEDIQVKVQHGWVTLTGEVQWNYQKQAAENAIHYLMGIKGIINQIVVKTLVDIQDVKAQIKDALRRIAIQEAEHIDVEIVGSTVVLRGVVHSFTDRKEIENAAWGAPGVMTVEDKLIVSE